MLQTPEKRAVPLRCWSRAQLAEAQRRLADVWRAWTAGWVVPCDTHGTQVDAFPADSVDGATGWSWELLGRGEGEAWHVGPAVPAGEMSAKIAARARADWAQALARKLQLPLDESVARPSPTLFRRWSGACIFAFRASGTPERHLLLDHAQMRTLLEGFDDGAAGQAGARRPLLSAVDEALQSNLIRVQARLASTQVDFASLADLAVGDVIALPHSLDSPLSLMLGETTLCGAFLGRKAGHRAVELVPAGAAPHPNNQLN